MLTCDSPWHSGQTNVGYYTRYCYPLGLRWDNSWQTPLCELANVVPDTAQVYDAKKNMNIHVAASSIVTSSYWNEAMLLLVWCSDTIWGISTLHLSPSNLDTNHPHLLNTWIRPSQLSLQSTHTTHHCNNEPALKNTMYHFITSPPFYSSFYCK